MLFFVFFISPALQTFISPSMGLFELSDFPMMDDFAAKLNGDILVRGIQIWLVYRMALMLYNISPWHPLYHFPGPRLAGMTFLYEFWFDFVRHGRYTWQIQKMHDKYGKTRPP